MKLLVVDVFQVSVSYTRHNFHCTGCVFFLIISGDCGPEAMPEGSPDQPQKPNFTFDD